MNLFRRLQSRWFSLPIPFLLCATVGAQPKVMLTPAKESAIRALPLFSNFDNSCRALFSPETPKRITYTAASLGSIDLDGGKAEILVIHPQCFAGGREEYIDTDSSIGDRFYDSGVVIMDGEGPHFLGRSCMMTDDDPEGHCAVSIEKVFDLARGRGQALIVKTDWSGVDSGGEYRDVYYRDAGQKKWHSYLIPDPKRDDGSDLCRVVEVGRYVVSTTSVNADVFLYETLSESKYEQAEIGTCMFRDTANSFVEIEIREDVLLEPAGALTKRYFTHGFAIPPQRLSAVRGGKTIAVASTTPVGLFSRDSRGSWQIEIPGRGRAQADEKDLFRSPSYWGFGAMIFGASDPGLESRRSKWEERDGEYTCYDSVSNPRFRIPTSTSTHEYEQISLSADGKRLLYEQFNWDKNVVDAHLMDSGECVKILKVDNVIRPISFDQRMERFIITRPGHEVSVLDRSGKELAVLGKFDGYSDMLLLSPNGRWALAYGVPGCVILNIETGTKAERLSAECTGKRIADDGQLTAE